MVEAPASRLTKPEPVEEEAEDRTAKCALLRDRSVACGAVVRAGTGPGPATLKQRRTAVTREDGKIDGSRPCPGFESPCSERIFGQADYCDGCIGTRRLLAAVRRAPGPGLPDDGAEDPEVVPLLPEDRPGPNDWDSPKWQLIRRIYPS